MAWNYDETDLTTDTASGRVNSVRLLVGDTDTNDHVERFVSVGNPYVTS